MDTKILLEQFQLVNFQKGKRITILGAGIAGLVAAYELERLGHEVEIMEGSIESALEAVYDIVKHKPVAQSTARVMQQANSSKNPQMVTVRVL
jgi:uncharacterized protein with NAD-binding domain and iron-sulfur cluster